MRGRWRVKENVASWRTVRQVVSLLETSWREMTGERWRPVVTSVSVRELSHVGREDPETGRCVWRVLRQGKGRRFSVGSRPKGRKTTVSLTRTLL